MQDEAATPSRKEVAIYTDGAAVPNPGAGGYGVVLRFGQHRKELSGGFRVTTPKKRAIKPNQSYYFAWYLYCPGCKSMYMVEQAKREVSQGMSDER
jgi:hypothetical protein